MKTKLLSIVFLFTNFCLYSQLDCVWAKNTLSNGNALDLGTLDLQVHGGYVYSLSEFDYAEDNSHMLLRKFDAATGAVVWNIDIGVDTNECFPAKMAVDGDGNIIVCGVFWGSLDFDPGVGSAILTSYTGEPSYSTTEMFIAKYNPNGNLLWAKKISDADHDKMRVAGVAVDNNNAIIITGFCNNHVDFDLGPGTEITNIDDRNFIVKYDADFNFLWAKYIRVYGYTMGIGDIDIDETGNIYVTGKFLIDIDFDYGTNNYYFNTDGTTDGFIAKYSPAGSIVWANIINTSMGVYGGSYDIEVTKDYFLITGAFVSSADFDIGPDSSIYTGDGHLAFIARYDTTCGFQWAKILEGYLDGAELAIDAQDNIYMTGAYTLASDFDPGPDSATVYCNHCLEIFMVKYTVNGDFVLLFNLENESHSGYNHGTSVVLDDSNYIYLQGYFSTEYDFDPGIGYDSLYPWNSDGNGFVAKYSQTDVTSVTEKPQPTSTLHIYPNPANDIVYIVANTNCTTNIEVIDITGRILQKRALTTSITSIDISGLSNGIYLCRLYSNGEIIETKKLVVN